MNIKKTNKIKRFHLQGKVIRIQRLRNFLLWYDIYISNQIHHLFSTKSILYLLRENEPKPANHMSQLY